MVSLIKSNLSIGSEELEVLSVSIRRKGKGNGKGKGKEGRGEGREGKGTEDGVEENPSGISKEEPGSNTESSQWPILVLNVTSLDFYITTR